MAGARGDKQMRNQDAAAYVIVDEGAGDEELEGLRRHLSEHGVAGSVEASYPEEASESLSVGSTHADPGVEGRYADPAWTILIHTRINDLVGAIEATRLREFVDGMRVLRASQTGTPPAAGMIYLVDEDTGIRFDAEFQLPIQAYADLSGIRVASFRADPVKFHRMSGRHGRWRRPR